MPGRFQFKFIIKKPKAKLAISRHFPGKVHVLWPVCLHSLSPQPFSSLLIGRWPRLTSHRGLLPDGLMRARISCHFPAHLPFPFTFSSPSPKDSIECALDPAPGILLRGPPPESPVFSSPAFPPAHSKGLDVQS